MRNKAVDFLIFWLPIFAGITLGGFAGNAWYGGDRILAIWLGIFGFACLAIVGGIQIYQGWGKSAGTSQTGSIGVPTEQRPWVSTDVELAGHLAQDAAGWDAGNRWHIDVIYKLRNTGKTPAVDAQFHANILPFIASHWPADRTKDGVPQGLPEPGTDVPAELKKMCNAISEMTKHLGALSGHMLFKDESITGRFGINGNPAIFEAAKRNQGFTGNFVLLACAVYGSTLDSNLHETAKAFALFKADSPGGKGRSISLDETLIPIYELKLAPQPNSGGYAN